MIIWLVKRLLPGYYNNVHNEAVYTTLEKLRVELYAEQPNHHDIVDRVIARAYKKHLRG